MLAAGVCVCVCVCVHVRAQGAGVRCACAYAVPWPLVHPTRLSCLAPTLPCCVRVHASPLGACHTQAVYGSMLRPLVHMPHSGCGVHT